MQSLKDMNIQEIINKIQELKHQSMSLNKKITYSCEICLDEGGTVKRADDGFEYYIECKCYKNSKVDRIMRASQITVEFRKKNFMSFHTGYLADIVRNAHKCSLNYISHFEQIKNDRQNSISLLGQSGSGKTHLLCSVANALLDKEIKIMYFPYVEGFNEIKDDFELLEQRINKMQKVEVLFIDDLFKGRKEPTNFQIEQIFAIINYRYINYLPILISSEKTINDLIYIDEAIGSRIYEMSKHYLVELQGENLNYRMRCEDDRN